MIKNLYLTIFTILISLNLFCAEDVIYNKIIMLKEEKPNFTTYQCFTFIHNTDLVNIESSSKTKELTGKYSYEYAFYDETELSKYNNTELNDEIEYLSYSKGPDAKIKFEEANELYSKLQNCVISKGKTREIKYSQLVDEDTFIKFMQMIKRQI